MFHLVVRLLYLAPRTPATCRAVLFAASSIIAVGCDGFTATSVEFTQADIEAVGAVQTLEIEGRVISSLPYDPVIVDDRQAELGRLLFWDPILSGDRDVACGTCHLPEFAYTDGQQRSIGAGGSGRGPARFTSQGIKVKRNAQTVLNTAWNGINEFGVFDPESAPMFWDNRSQSLAAQALEPVKSHEEMRGDNLTEQNVVQEIESRLNALSLYQLKFSQAFGHSAITITEVTRALAAFQSTLVANDSPFDRWMRGEESSMTDTQVSGMQEFVIAGCADCHSGPLFSDFETHILGVQEGAGLITADDGDGSFAFRTPTLRQLKFTAPYFHAGQFSTLSRALDFYDEPRRSANPNVASSSLDPELLEVPEMDGGRAAIIASFLDALNDESFDRRIPAVVPSGLPPGGFIVLD